MTRLVTSTRPAMLTLVSFLLRPQITLMGERRNKQIIKLAFILRKGNPVVRLTRHTNPRTPYQYQSLSVFLPLCVCLSHCLSFSVCLSFSLCLSVCLCLSVSPSLLPSLPPPLPPRNTSGRPRTLQGKRYLQKPQARLSAQHIHFHKALQQDRELLRS